MAGVVTGKQFGGIAQVKTREGHKTLNIKESLAINDPRKGPE